MKILNADPFGTELNKYVSEWEVELDDLEKQCFHDFHARVEELIGPKAGYTDTNARLRSLSEMKVLYASLDGFTDRDFWNWLFASERN